MSKGNRVLAVKNAKAKLERREFVRLEASKSCYLAAEYRLPLFDAATIETFNGREVERVPMGVTRRSRFRRHF